MKRTLLAGASVLALFTAAPAFAQSNTSTVGQSGASNAATVEQAGSDNTSDVSQDSTGTARMTTGPTPAAATLPTCRAQA